MQPNPAGAAIIQSSGDVDPFSQPFTSWRFAVELARGPTEISSQLTTLLCRLPGLYLRESAASPLCAARLRIYNRQANRRRRSSAHVSVSPCACLRSKSLRGGDRVTPSRKPADLQNSPYQVDPAVDIDRAPSDSLGERRRQIGAGEADVHDVDQFSDRRLP